MSTPGFARLALVDRGAPALRVIQAVDELNDLGGTQIAVIALHRSGARRTMPVREAHEILEIGAGDGAGIDAAALEVALLAARVDAVWCGADEPERAALAQACDRLGLTVMGPGAAVLGGARDEDEEARMAAEAGIALAEGVPVASSALRLEVEVIADGRGKARALGVRDAGTRRDGRSVIAESASPAVGPGAEREIRAAAVRLALVTGHRGTGAFDVVFDPQEGRVTFAGVAALRRDHQAVTEMVTGLDLVKLELDLAAGGHLGGEPPCAIGHAVSTVLCAESGAGSGHVELLRPPTGPFIRVDTALGEGDVPEPSGAIADIAAWGRDRPEALARLRRALRETMVVLGGGTTNQGYLLELLGRPELRSGAAATGWLDRLHVDGGLVATRDADVALLQAALEVAEAETAIDRARFAAFARRGRPQADAPIARIVDLLLNNLPYRFAVSQVGPSRHRVTVDTVAVEIDVERRGVHERRLAIGGRSYRTLTTVDGAALLVEVDGVSHRIARDDGGVIRNAAPAVVVRVPVAVGDEVRKGDVVAVVESMKMESSYVAPFDGRVRRVYTGPNVQAGPGAPLVQLEQLERPQPPAGAEAVRFSATAPDEDPVARHRAALRTLEWQTLGYDVEPSESERAVQELTPAVGSGPRRGAGERRLLELYADLQALTRPRHDDDDFPGRSPEEDFFAWLGELDVEGAGVAPHVRQLLARALAHYGIDGMARTPALEDAAYRLFLAQRRSAGPRAAVLSLLDACLDHDPDGPGESDELFREALDRLVVVAERRDPVLGDVARECRWRLFDEPLVAAAHLAVDEAARRRLDELCENPERTDRAELIAELVACPRPLFSLLAERLGGASGAIRAVLLEVMTRRFYRMPSLLGFEEVDGLLTGSYRFQGVERHLATRFVEAGGLEPAVQAFAVFAGTLRPGDEASADFYLERHVGDPAPDATAQALREVIDRVALPAGVHRVVVAIADPAHDANGDAVEVYTFRPGPEGVTEDAEMRGVHPMMADRLHFWRLSEFDLERLPSADDIYVFHAVARTNPKDERLVAIAEVRDLTPVRDEQGALVALPEFERMYIEALEGLRGYQAHRQTSRRLQWNRVFLYVWPEIDLEPAELKRVVARLAPSTEGLGIEMVLVRGRLRDAGGSVRERVLRFFSPAGTGILVEVDDPPTEPLQPLDEPARRVIAARRRGTPHPAEVLKLLGGTFVEHDLGADGRLVPVDRPIAMNEAAVVVGIVRNVTARHPEGMLRVALLGDPTKALGSLAEPECRRINAAIALATELGVPLEWFAISAGAKIAMDNGTEGMDWISDVLRRIIEFTQAGGEVNVVVTGINVGAQPYWNAEATMLMHTRGILVMTPDSAMVLTGKQALDFSGGVSAEDNFGIGGYERIMGPNGQAQYWAPDLATACGVLLRYYDHAYVAPGERFPRRAATADPADRDVCDAPHAAPGSDLMTVGEIFSDATNPGRKKPFAIRSVMRAIVDADHEPLERWAAMRDAENAVVWDAHLGGWPVALIGIESHPLPRIGEVPADGPDRWTSGTLFPRSSKKIARAINAVGGRRPLVVVANLSGFDGSPDSMRSWQLEFGAEIGRAVVNFAGPIVFCVVSRYHGGAFVVFSRKLNEHFESIALEGTHASVIGGAPAAAVVFARDVQVAARTDARIVSLDERIAAAEGGERQRLRVERASLWAQVHSEKLGALATEFDQTHSVERAVRVGSVNQIIAPSILRPHLIDAIERGMRRVAGESE